MINGLSRDGCGPAREIDVYKRQSSISFCAASTNAFLWFKYCSLVIFILPSFLKDLTFAA